MQHQNFVEAMIDVDRAEAIAQPDVDAWKKEGVGEQEILDRIHHLGGGDARQIGAESAAQFCAQQPRVSYYDL